MLMGSVRWDVATFLGGSSGLIPFLMTEVQIVVGTVIGVSLGIVPEVGIAFGTLLGVSVGLILTTLTLLDDYF